MKPLSALVLSVVAIGMAGFAGAQDKDDPAKLLVGKWEVTKAGGDVPVGSTVEFTKDGKLTAVVKAPGKDETFTGAYKLEKDRLNLKITVEGQTVEHALTVKKLTADTLELEDENKKTDVLTRKK